MDLLFSRYASPILLLDTVIQTTSLLSFVNELIEVKEEEKNWEFFLNKVYDQSWSDFLNEIKPNNEINPNVNLGETVKKSRNMLNQFKPQERG